MHQACELEMIYPRVLKQETEAENLDQTVWSVPDCRPSVITVSLLTSGLNLSSGGDRFVTSLLPSHPASTQVMMVSFRSSSWLCPVRHLFIAVPPGGPS